MEEVLTACLAIISADHTVNDYDNDTDDKNDRHAQHGVGYS